MKAKLPLLIPYWLATAVVTAVFGLSIYLHLFETAMLKIYYSLIGFPEWVVVPSGILKVIAVVFIWTRKPKPLTEWAYAGLFIDALLATGAHGFVEGNWMGYSVYAIIALVVSRSLLFLLDRKRN